MSEVLLSDMVNETIDLMKKAIRDFVLNKAYLEQMPGVLFCLNDGELALYDKHSGITVVSRTVVTNRDSKKKRMRVNLAFDVHIPGIVAGMMNAELEKEQTTSEH